MMNKVWFQVLAVMVVGSIVKYLWLNQLAWVGIDLVVLLTAYLILRRNPFINLKRSMIFLSGLTLINVLVDLKVLGVIASNLVLLLLLAWMLFGDRFNSYPKVRHKFHK